MTLQFQTSLKQQLSQFLIEEESRIGTDFVKIDLHCHDHNSTIPDETLGRILGVPETWLPTKDLLTTLRSAGTHAITITNHNNARSCFDLLNAGEDIVVGAEFTCDVPDLDIGIHVLAYGFTPQQEIRLNHLRKNLYHFLAFTKEQNIPTIWAHPLNFYAPNRTPSPESMEKLLLCFERFECMNGQRNSWQNLLTTNWVKSATPEKIERISKRTGLSPTEFCSRAHTKILTGGSDDHFGVFAGTTGTLIKIPNLKERLKERPMSDLVLEALRWGDVAPYGGWNDGEKLSLALLDYLTSLALNMEDPGLGRIFLHKGTNQEKLIAIGITNAVHELRRHRFTMHFLRAFHHALRGQRPGMLTRFLMRRRHGRFLDLAERFAHGPNLLRLGEQPKVVMNVHFLFRAFAELTVEKLAQHLKKLEVNGKVEIGKIDDILSKLELPSTLRNLVADGNTGNNKSRYSKVPFSIGKVVDSLSFPVIASGIVLSAAFASAKVLHKERSFLTSLAKEFPTLNPPQRILWVTDTFCDKNGVSGVLQQVLKEIHKYNLPIDILTCHSSLQSENNLHVVKPLGEFTLASYPQQPFRIPDILEIHDRFEQGAYGQIICSTEGPMMFVALYLKHAHSVPAHFFVHTDWLAFCRDTLHLSEIQSDRVRRILRTMYKSFDGLFVLNSEQRTLFGGRDFQIPANKIFQTAHWPDSIFRPISTNQQKEKRDDTAPILMFAGRLSAEKGIFDLPEIFAAARAENSNVRFVIAGTGPDERALKQAMPEAEFLGWQTSEDLCQWYNRASMLLLPSRFDTFGCVVLEAMACGLPVCAYRNKGPADIIIHEKCGFLSENAFEMAIQVTRFVSRPSQFDGMRKAAISRAAQYSSADIMKELMRNVGVDTEFKIQNLNAKLNPDISLKFESASEINAAR